MSFEIHVTTIPAGLLSFGLKNRWVFSGLSFFKNVRGKHRKHRKAAGLQTFLKDTGIPKGVPQAFFLTFSKKLKPEKTQLSKKLNDFSGQNSTNR